MPGMYGIHDLGGLDGFGPVQVEADEPPFHEPWERRAFGVTATIFTLLEVGGQFRHSIERMDPVHYLSSSYYEHWVTGGATALIEEGHFTREELEAKASGFPLSRPLAAVPAQPVPDSAQPRFQPGDRVRVRQWHWLGHTRCPRYVQGKRGTVVRSDVIAPLPDVWVHTGQKVRVPTYSVRFEPSELWGPGTEAGAAAIHVDLWETYLDADGDRP
jgi:nitrile hydratase